MRSQCIIILMCHDMIEKYLYQIFLLYGTQLTCQLLDCIEELMLVYMFTNRFNYSIRRVYSSAKN